MRTNYAPNPCNFNYFQPPAPHHYLYPNTNCFSPPISAYQQSCYAEPQQQVCRTNGTTMTGGPKANCHCSNCNYEIYQFVELHDVGCSQSGTDLKETAVVEAPEERPVKDDNCAGVSNSKSLPATLHTEPEIPNSQNSDQNRNQKSRLTKPSTNCIYYETKNKRVSGLKDILVEQKKNKTNLTISHPIIIFDQAPRSDNTNINNNHHHHSQNVCDEIGDQKVICQKCNKLRLPISSSFDQPQIRNRNKAIVSSNYHNKSTNPLFRFLADKLKNFFTNNTNNNYVHSENIKRGKVRLKKTHHTLRKTRPVLLLRGKTYVIDDKDSFLKRHRKFTSCP